MIREQLEIQKRWYAENKRKAREYNTTQIAPGRYVYLLDIASFDGLGFDRIWVDSDTMIPVPRPSEKNMTRKEARWDLINN